MKWLEIFTDGSCIGNPGPGGYCTIIQYKHYEKIFSGGYYLTTNNRMEIISAITALESVNKNYFLSINTDSQYLRQGITNWIYNWKQRDWKNSYNKPIKNIDLWMYLYKLIQNYKINWSWIKSHSGNLNNERCDKLARTAALNPTLNDLGYTNNN